MEEINILFSVNKKFLEHIEELIVSILHYSSRNVNFYLMYIEGELTGEDIQHIENFVNQYSNGKIIPIKFNAKQLNGMPIEDDEGDFFGLEAYSRLFSPFALPRELDKVLYLDADMICTGDIAELYDIDFEDKMWCACRDNGIKESDLKRLEIPLDCNYINSGMLLINLKKIRQYYNEEVIVELIRRYKDILIYPDQDFINKVFYSEIKIINQKYNLIAKDIKYRELEEKPLIIHYAGSVKPWNDDVSRFEIEYLEPYYEILELQNDNKRGKLEKLLIAHHKYGYNKE